MSDGARSWRGESGLLRHTPGESRLLGHALAWRILETHTHDRPSDVVALPSDVRVGGCNIVLEEREEEKKWTRQSGKW